MLTGTTCRRFDVKQKWANPLMGWTSGKDTMGTQLMENLVFPDR